MDEKNVKAFGTRASARKEMFLFKLAEIDYQTALALDPTSKALQVEAGKVKELLGEEGSAAFKLGDFKEALRLYTITLSKNPKNPQVLANRAMAHIKLKKFA